MRRRIGGRQLDRMAALRELYRDRRGQRRLAHAALAHHHDQAVPVRRQLVDQGGERPAASRIARGVALACGSGATLSFALRKARRVSTPSASKGRSETWSVGSARNADGIAASASFPHAAVAP